MKILAGSLEEALTEATVKRQVIVDNVGLNYEGKKTAATKTGTMLTKTTLGRMSRKSAGNAFVKKRGFQRSKNWHILQTMENQYDKMRLYP